MYRFGCVCISVRKKRYGVCEDAGSNPVGRIVGDIKGWSPMLASVVFWRARGGLMAKTVPRRDVLLCLMRKNDRIK